MRLPHFSLTLGLGVLLVSCTAPEGQVCSSGSQCPVSSYCLLDQCVAPSTVSRNLSVVVTPSDPALAVQQFLPQQFQTVDGFSTILLDAPQVLRGHVALPANCPSDAGYPVHFELTGPTVIPGVANSFQFDTDKSGNLSAVLPIGSYAERVSTAVACAAPLYADHIVISGSPYDAGQIELFAPILEPGPSPPAGGQNTGRASLDISGEVAVLSDAGLPSNATVRILALSDAGGLASTRLSGDQPLQLIDGRLWFGSTFVPGGPATLPVLPYGSTPAGVPGLIQNKASTACVLDEGVDPTPTTCDQFVLEIGPSSARPYLTTIDKSINAPELDDAGDNPLVILHTVVTLPLNPTLTFDLPIAAIVPDGGPIPWAAVTISSVESGIAGCPPSVCHLTATGITDPANGTFTFPVLPGRYALTLDPPTPLGSSVTVVDVLDGGELAVVSGPGSLTGDGVEIEALAPVELKGTVREPSGKPGVIGPFLPSGEVEILTIADLVPVALGAVSDGMFDLRVPPGQYVLLVKPDSSTRFPVFHTPITIEENLPSQSYVLVEPGLLSGIVEVEVDGGLPIPTQAYLEFYDVTSDSDGVVSYPVATAVTDSEGRWSAAGPPGQ